MVQKSDLEILESQPVRVFLGTDSKSLSMVLRFNTDDIVSDALNLLNRLKEALKEHVQEVTVFCVRLDQESTFRPGLTRTTFKSVELINPIPSSPGLEPLLYDVRNTKPVVSMGSKRSITPAGVEWERHACTDLHWLAVLILITSAIESAHASFLLKAHKQLFAEVHEPLTSLFQHQYEDIALYWYYKTAEEARTRVYNWLSQIDFVLYRELRKVKEVILSKSDNGIFDRKNRCHPQNLEILLIFRTVWDLAEILHSREIAADAYFVYDTLLRCLGVSSLPDREEYAIFLWQKRRTSIESNSPLRSFLEGFIETLTRIIKIRLSRASVIDQDHSFDGESVRVLSGLVEAVERICDIGGLPLSQTIKSAQSIRTRAKASIGDGVLKDENVIGENLVTLSMMLPSEGEAEFVGDKIQDRVTRLFQTMGVLTSSTGCNSKDNFEGEQLWHQEGREGYRDLDQFGVPFPSVIIPAVCVAHIPWPEERDALLGGEDVRSFLHNSVVNPNFRFRMLRLFIKSNRPSKDPVNFVREAALFIRQQANKYPHCTILGGVK